MKRLFAVVLIGLLISSFCSCAGNVSKVEVLDYSSEIYTQQEIEDAIDVAKAYFKQEFNGCTLTEITYIGDAENGDYAEFAQSHNADEVIVLVSTFDVGPLGGDGSLNTNYTYENWMWILVRRNGGEWRHADHGY